MLRSVRGCEEVEGEEVYDVGSDDVAEVAAEEDVSVVVASSVVAVACVVVVGMVVVGTPAMQVMLTVANI